MKIFIVLAFAFVIGLGLIFVPPVMLSDSYAVDQPLGGQVGPTTSQIIPGEYIVTLKDEFIGEPPAGDQDLSNSSLKKERQEILIEADKVDEQLEDEGGNVTQIYDRIINGFAVEGIDNPTTLIQNPAIEAVEPNVRNFPQAQYLPRALDRLDIDRAVTPASRPDNREQKPNIDVAVIDQQINSHHPDLNVISRTNAIDGCGSKKVNTPDGLVTVQCFNEDGYHATHVAGSIAARDNLGGIVGGLPGARIHGFAICSKNAGCDDADTLRAWNAIISRGDIEIANLSVGGNSVPSSAMQTGGQNLINAGVTMFASAGNANANADGKSYCGIDAFICVSALQDTDGKCGGLGPSVTSSGGTTVRDDQKAAFSNYGSDVDIMAPGVYVLSTWPGEIPATNPDGGSATFGNPYIGTSEQGRYGAISGTSMASPIAAGIGALIKSKNPSWTPAQIKTDMLAKAYAQNQACDGQGKGGLVSDNSPSSEKLLYAQPY